MKVICDGLDLSDALLKVSKALSVKTTNPILEGIKLCAKDDSLTLTATDMELTIKKTIKADVLMEGETVVVGKYFVELAKRLEKERVELSKLNDEQLLIRYSDSESKLSIFPIENYPIIEMANDGDIFSLTQSQFKSLIEKTVFSCSIDDSRPILKGCLFEIKDNLLNVVSLDGFRMAIKKEKVLANGNFSVIIPARTLIEITKILDKDDETIKVIINKNVLFIEVENTVLISRLIDGEFIKYSHILPTDFENKVIVKKDALENSLERASIVVKNDKINIIKLDIKENNMSVISKSEIGNVNESINISLTGKDMSIAFNSKYLLDFIKITNSEFISINLNSSIDPCIIKPIDDENFIYLLLPIRINE